MMTTTTLIELVVASLAVIMSVVALGVALWAVVETKALKNSTHTIVRQMQPIDADGAWPTEDQLRNDFTSSEENFFTDPPNTKKELADEYI